MDARCPKCEKVAVLDDDIKNVKCPHCGFEETYDNYIEIMKENAIKSSTICLWDFPSLFKTITPLFVAFLFSIYRPNPARSVVMNGTPNAPVSRGVSL